MKNTLLMLFILVNVICNGQTIKNYSGIYGYGKISYQYYENESFERIYQGPYEFMSNTRIEWIGPGTELIKGNFANNLQNGTWFYSFKNEKKENCVSIAGNYKNGLMEGLWTKIITSPLKKTIRQKLVANFKDGKLVGDFYFAQNEDIIKGKFNDNSHFEGRWVVKYKNRDKRDEPCEIIYDFNDGKLTFVLNRSLASGEILYKNDKFENEDVQSYLPYGSLQYIFNITNKLKQNKITNGFLLNYGSIDDGSTMFNYGIAELKYDLLK